MDNGINDVAVLHMTTPRLNPLESTDDIADTADVVTILNALFADNVSAKKAFAILLKHVKTKNGAKDVHHHLGELTILAILRMKLGVPVIQSYGFVLIRKLSCVCVESNRLFVDNGAIEIISNGLRRFPQDMILQTSAAGAIVPLIQNYQQTISILITQGLVPVLLRPILFRTEETPNQIILYTCSIINAICDAQGKDIIDTLLSGQVAGSDPSWPILKELLHILESTMENENTRKIASAVCATLLCLMSMDRMVTDVLEEMHGLSIVSHAMVQYASDNGVQKYSGIVCQQLARSPVKTIRMQSPHKAEAIYKARQFIATSPKKPIVKEGIVYDFMPKLNDPDKDRVLAQTQVAERASRGNLLTSAYGFSKPQRKLNPSPPKEVKARPPARLPSRVLTTKSPVKPSPQQPAIRQG
ncbi:hypothetical protein THRCLA_01797 [Thraustotheca clavata]|uniref:Uncharacterized protein n=1 Tax=Thraustotheca clavata TaxID=74557 RepID=A0A1W0A7D7_9STRA|nr:hypothetical protein THRCLA_01797 [Thraustotheca clavata]